ncbi:GNAT family N-acetyltransferase [Porticoccus sp.]|uniref:GNAT family N-acetyltransferase n=1 Tax=Porticoccus sp. TaxID=2024853 RepID=UPI003F69B37D
METIDFFPIEVEQTSWQNSNAQLKAIRYQVFVKEQHVPEEEEIDEYDLTAIHWLAYGPHDTAMATARMLPDGQIGRMAVLEEYRQMGVGSAMMRKIIKYAVREGLQKLTLNAQIKALPFYEGLGFASEGEPFIDAGIPHKKMVLDLHQYTDNTPKPALKEISEEDRQKISIEGVDKFRNQAVTLVQLAHREIRIFSEQLEAVIYSNTEFCDAIYTFATSHPLARVKILVRDLYQVTHQTNQLKELCHRLPSRIQMRKFNSLEPCLHREFLLIDKSGILYKQEPERFIGYAVSHAPLEAIELVEEFDKHWEQGDVDPELRRLNI